MKTSLKHPPKILVVDNEEFFFALLKLYAEEAHIPFDWIWSFGGNDALDRIKAGKKFDAILMNIVMSHGDGITTAQKIRQLGIKTPIIAWTYHDAWQENEACKKLGMDQCIPKNGSSLLKDVLGALKNVGINS